MVSLPPGSVLISEIRNRYKSNLRDTLKATLKWV
jgi:hypothetical protein